MIILWSLSFRKKLAWSLYDQHVSDDYYLDHNKITMFSMNIILIIVWSPCARLILPWSWYDHQFSMTLVMIKVWSPWFRWLISNLCLITKFWWLLSWSLQGHHVFRDFFPDHSMITMFSIKHYHDPSTITIFPMTITMIIDWAPCFRRLLSCS